MPWIGGFIAASATLHAETEQGRVNELNRRWVEEHQQKIQELNETLAQMMTRLEQLGPQVEERLGDESYASLPETTNLPDEDGIDSNTPQLMIPALTGANSGAYIQPHG